MTVLDRSDWMVDGVLITRKKMPNGETRTRMKLPDGTATIFTEMEEYSWDKSSLPWQEPHFHKGLTECYLVVKGLVCVIDFFSDNKKPPRCTRYTIGQHFKMWPGQAHCILLSPSAILQTTRYGSPIGNPEKEGKDWWPYPELDSFISRMHGIRFKNLFRFD